MYARAAVRSVCLAGTLLAAAVSLAEEISSMLGAGLDSSSNSWMSRASRESPPTTATRCRRVRASANLLLLCGRPVQPAPQYSSQANRNAASHVATGH